MRWIYERIHFDPKPIDVAIVGPSREQLGFSAAAIEQDLAQRGKHANVVNFALPGAGRDIQWAILDELFKAKSPKVIVLGVEEQPYPFGHFFFKYVAPAEAIVFPPSPFLHNYLYNLAYLPIRKLKLFGANLFPDLFGLSKAIRSGALRAKPHRLHHELHRRRQAGRHGASGSARDPPRSSRASRSREP